MEDKKINDIMAIIFSASFLFFIIVIALLLFENNKLIDQNYNLTTELLVTERFRMYDSSLINESNYVNGIARDDKFYCIWTANRSAEDINMTIQHERYHILISKNKHFCED